MLSAVRILSCITSHPKNLLLGYVLVFQMALAGNWIIVP
jgi:hypothetical protein